MAQITWRNVNAEPQSVEGFLGAGRLLSDAARGFRSGSRDMFKLRDMENAFVTNQAIADALSGRVNPSQIRDPRVDATLLEDAFMGQKKNRSLLETDRLLQEETGLDIGKKRFDYEPGRMLANEAIDRLKQATDVNRLQSEIRNNDSAIALRNAQEAEIERQRAESERLLKAGLITEANYAATAGDAYSGDINATLPATMQDMAITHDLTIAAMQEQGFAPSEIEAERARFRKEVEDTAANMSSVSRDAGRTQAQQEFSDRKYQIAASLGVPVASLVNFGPGATDARLEAAALEQQQLELAATRAQDKVRLGYVSKARAGEDYSGIFVGPNGAEASTDPNFARGNSISDVEIRTAIRDRYGEDIDPLKAKELHDTIKGNRSAFEALLNGTDAQGNAAFSQNWFNDGFDVEVAKDIGGRLLESMKMHVNDPTTTATASTPLSSNYAVRTKAADARADAEWKRDHPGEARPGAKTEEPDLETVEGVEITAKNLRAEADAARERFDALSASVPPTHVGLANDIKLSLGYINSNPKVTGAGTAFRAAAHTFTLPERIAEMNRVQTMLNTLEEASDNAKKRQQQDEVLRKAFKR